jgi:hypothetical protein
MTDASATSVASEFELVMEKLAESDTPLACGLENPDECESCS